jgi:tagatose 6-phosphate kinase
MIVGVGVTPAFQRTMTFTRLVVDTENRARRVTTIASGKSCNVVRVVRRLGEKAIATGFLGGASGQSIRNALDVEHVSHDFVDTGTPTRICTTLIDEENGTATELVEEAAPVPEADYDRLLQKVDLLLAGASLIVLSGGLTPRAPQDFFARCVEHANQQGVCAIVDTRGEPLTRALKHRPALIKPNARELAATVHIDPDNESDLLKGMRQMIALGAGAILVTRGGHHPLFMQQDRAWRIIIPKVDVVSAIGSGDCVAAAIAVKLKQGADLQSAIPFALACGCANTLHPEAATFDVETLEQLHEKVRMIPVD